MRLCIRIDLVCSLDNEPECTALYERVREVVDIVAFAIGSRIEFRKLILPAPKEWFDIELPILIVNENGVIRAIELPMSFGNTDQVISPNVIVYSVGEILLKGNSYENQILRVEAVNL